MLIDYSRQLPMRFVALCLVSYCLRSGVNNLERMRAQMCDLIALTLPVVYNLTSYSPLGHVPDYVLVIAHLLLCLSAENRMWASFDVLLQCIHLMKCRMMAKNMLLTLTRQRR